MSIGQKIHAARAAAGLSVAQLARAVGVTEKAVRLWEAGERGPMFRNVVAISKATEHELAWFADEEEVEGDAAADQAVHR